MLRQRAGRFFAAHDRWLFGHACVRTHGDRELAADLVQDTFEAAARAWAMLRGHADNRQRAWLLSTLAHKDVSDFRRQEAFRRRQPDIHARYQPTAADTEAQALNAIALARAREIIDGHAAAAAGDRAAALAGPAAHGGDRGRLGWPRARCTRSCTAARRKLIAGLEPYYPIRRQPSGDQQSGEGTGP